MKPALKSWQCFAWLIVRAVTYYFLGKILLVIAAIVALVRAGSWFCRRFPRTAWFGFGLTRGLSGGRGTRRR
jgi:hypothetical protein